MSRAIRLDCGRALRVWRASGRTTRVAQDFGLAPRRRRTILDGLTVSVGPGRIVAICGPSGCGKTTALGLIARCYPAAIHVDRVAFPTGTPLVDCIAPTETLSGALSILSACALGEAPKWLRAYEELSEGEKFRARLARAVGAAARRGAAAVLIADEFAQQLHRRAAKAVAYNLRKLTTRRRLSVVVATSNTDVLSDLQADTVVTLGADRRHEVAERPPRRRPFSLWRRLRIEPGTRSDYSRFAAMHYRDRDHLGFVDRIFVLRDGSRREPLGIVVYAYPPAELALRNAVTAGRFSGNLDELNRNVRILRRLVLHPDIRGCGIGHRFVRRTLPMAGTRYVECLASMGTVNPVFERAGMTRVGTCPLPRRAAAVLAKLAALDVDVHAADLATRIARRMDVRALAVRLVTDWYRATTGRGRGRPARQSPRFIAQIVRSIAASRPVYYLWDRDSPIAKHAGAKGCAGGSRGEFGTFEPDRGEFDGARV